MEFFWKIFARTVTERWETKRKRERVREKWKMERAIEKHGVERWSVKE